MSYHVLNDYILWNSKGEWLLTSKENYFAEHINMNQVERLGSDYDIAFANAAWEHNGNITIMSGNTPQV